GEGKVELRVKHNDGYYMWVEAKGKRFIDVNGERKLLLISRDITQRKKFERELKESEEKYRIISETAYDLIIVLNKKFKYEYVNENAFQQVLGYSKEDLLRKSALKFAHPNDIPNTTRILFDGFKQGRGEAEFRLKHKDGHWLWFEGKGKTFIDNDGDVKAIIISRDITERKKAEEKLKASEEKYRDLVNRIPDLLLEVDLKGKFTYASPQLYDIFGFTPSEIQNKRLHKFIHPDDMLTVVEAMKRGFKTRDNITVEYRTLHKDGHYVFASAKGSLLENGRFYGVVRDISEKRIMEQRLKESEEKYRLISESANDLIRVLNDKFEFEYINENVHKRLLGYKKEDLIGQTHLPFLHPEDRRHAIRSTVRNLKRGEGSYQARFKDKDGNYKWFEFAGKYFFDSKGEKKILSIARDINERKLAELKLKESERKYREAYNRANFYRDLFAHDINNILHIINSSAELIPYHLTGSEKSKVIADISNIIGKQVERGAKLVSNVQTLSKLEEEEIHTQPTEICDLMMNSIDFVKKAYNEKKIHIDVGCVEDHMVVYANELLQDVFENILINSVKYNENSNIEIYIKASKTLVVGKKYNKIEFIDNGIGVPDDRKKIIFKRGNRELKGAKGMGLGLSLVKKILKSFKGKIWVEDKVKGDYTKGSNFVILLPELN
ncbi:MAG: PAS domain S-box protein, partial [Candidatus Hodarchaeota archaeon]